jgi:uncharacterized protein (DUF488 family)
VAGLVYTIGTSTRTIEEFISLCQRFDLEAVVDVRRFPFSKLEHFRKKDFSSELQRRGIKYFYLGDPLGGYREEGYDQYTRSAEFRKGMQKLKEVASEHRAALVCAERSPDKCHRRFIAARLKADGWQVTHIVDGETTWKQEDAKEDLRLDI